MDRTKLETKNETKNGELNYLLINKALTSYWSERATRLLESTAAKQARTTDLKKGTAYKQTPNYCFPGLTTYSSSTNYGSAPTDLQLT